MHGVRRELGDPFVRTHELEAPGQRGRLSEDLRIEEVAQPHDGPADAHRDHNAVQRPDIGQFVPAREEPQSDQQTDGGAVAGHAAVAEARDDGPRLRKILHRIVEEAVPQPCAEDRGERTVDEYRLRDFLRKPFAPDEIIEEFGPDQDGQRPHQAIVPNVQRSDGKEHRIEIPDDGQRL